MKNKNTQESTNSKETKTIGRLRNVVKRLGAGVQKDVALEPVAETVLSYEEFEKARLDNGFEKGHHGTFWNLDRSQFLYRKPCHVAGTADQATEALALLRYATSKGVLYPETKWGIYTNPEGKYQLFATTPALVDVYENDRNPVEGRKLLKHISHGSGTFFNDLFAEDSQVLEMYRRLDPNFDPAKYRKDGSLVVLLDAMEASHEDNWGWDASGKIYPIDVEVIGISDEHHTDFTAVIHDWYVQQDIR